MQNFIWYNKHKSKLGDNYWDSAGLETLKNEVSYSWNCTQNSKSGKKWNNILLYRL